MKAWTLQELRDRYLVEETLAGCWLTRADRQQISRDKAGNQPLIYVVAWEAVNGSMPEGKQACHTCDNGRCFNPAHIWAGSISDNARDAYAKGRRRSPFSDPLVRAAAIAKSAATRRKKRLL